ncbi:MAG: hypothetical protein KA270_08750 [Saprospiraceae bacterium]|nr:hypothetical protein [Saprospiraceae bacterium]MBP6567243.1 hypothetical protein [Saprospiraceae bacterium]
MSGTFNTPVGKQPVHLEYVGYVTDAGIGPITVTPLNSDSPNYLGNISWNLNDPSSMTGSTLVDKFTIYTFLDKNFCTTSGVSSNTISEGIVSDAQTITIGTGGFGSVHGIFRITVYPGAFAT